MCYEPNKDAKAKGVGLFESAAFISYTGRMEKCRRMIRELERIGVERYDVEMNVPSPFDAVLFRSLKTSMNMKYVNVMLGHYRIVKRALEIGVQSILVMEDDCRFLKDAERLERDLKSLPVCYDLALLDSVQPYNSKDDDFDKMQGARINTCWCRLNVKRVSSACYALSHTGMERYTSLVEKAASGVLPLRAPDQYFEPGLWNGLNCYCAVPNLAIQCRSYNTTTAYDSIANSYVKEGVKVDDYAAY